ncbi:TB2/DP1, HVA22 family-domain-containing protein [Radiomyces spectabilis]|uniref:TB2/DP1, HVA22 family-domain-containing protein n=1 Tax=Radiomyces spectabilis TaxID=64574 RepID=UPI00221F9897|nr:TB2/DP1, HVA22 family-domain-containing protein [Radiomyces spectabilis]KAI8393524.1 TB2/DP1, HVA22 family-domain-containing protein [Radiomyces spectabilis]
MRSTSLFIAVLGVAYPAWRCWHLVKQHENEQTIEHLQDCKGWVTYWIIFGILHVLDNWNPQLLSMFPNYNLYKIALLYWAQSPHSKGASILHRHVLQKPEQSTNPPPAPHPQPSHTSPFPRKPSLYDADDLTLTIERRSMRLLDGYIPSLDLSGSSRNHSRQSSVNGHIVTPENEEIHEPSKTAQFPMAISADEATW